MLMPWNRTKFQAGGCRGVGSHAGPKLCSPANWTHPRWIDSRPYCLVASDQGKTSQCAAYSVAGWLETRNWRTTHVAEQVDAAPIYAEAKRIDGTSSEGTYLTSVAQAVQNLKLVQGTIRSAEVRTLDDLQFALHRDAVCLGAFMATRGWNACDPKTGWIGGSSEAVGGHAVLMCWYQDGKGVGWQNSWSPTWGMQGFGRMTEAQFREQWLGGLALEIV